MQLDWTRSFIFLPIGKNRPRSARSYTQSQRRRRAGRAEGLHRVSSRQVSQQHSDHQVCGRRGAGRTIVDIFGLEAGKIVEHWDVIQDVPEQAANTNAMF
jgi:hypothetical protein